MKKLLLITMLFLGNQVFADHHKGPHEACKEDAAKLCAGVPRGDGKVAQCLKSHENELSQACKDEHAANKKHRHDFMVACKADLKTHCKDVKAGKGAKLQCLKEKESMLSDTCKAELGEHTNPS